ncbi:Hypothetical protein DHA2_3920 [Giardia duodenalis]|uniref:Uncharacterized protein n=1 Tax=Giardia intestinalis TaxID=5741 RepID=V6TDY9_GIAIN|nr:Hypothetical protein DHA2_3920 [Giardia intestinalis]
MSGTGHLRQILDNYGYQEPLPDDAVPLVSHMSSDMAGLRAQLSQSKKQMTSLQNTIDYQTKMIDPLQADNQQLLAENNDLYMRLHEMQDAQALGYSVPEPVPLVHRGPLTFAAELHALESEVRNLRAFGAEVTKREDNLKVEVSHLKSKNKALESQLSAYTKVRKGSQSGSSRSSADTVNPEEVKLLNSQIMQLKEDLKAKNSNLNNMTAMLMQKDRTIAALTAKSRALPGSTSGEPLLEREDEGASDISNTSTNHILTSRGINQFTPRPMQNPSIRTQPVVHNVTSDDIDDVDNADLFQDDVIPEPYRPASCVPSGNGVLSGLESDNLTAPSTSSDVSINRPSVSTANLPAQRAHVSMSPEYDVATSKIRQISGNLYGAENPHSNRHSRSSSPNTVHPCSMGPRHSSSPHAQPHTQSHVDTSLTISMTSQPYQQLPPAPQHPLPYNMQIPNPGCINCAKLTTENARLKHQISSLTSENMQLKVSNNATLSNRDRFAMQMQSEVQERERVMSSLQSEVDVGRNQIAALKKENVGLQEQIELQRAEIADLTSANAVITTLSSKLEQKVADNVDSSLKLKAILAEYEQNIKLSTDKIKENSRAKRTLEKQLSAEREKISELKARIILDQETIKRLNETNKKLSKMMAQVVIENRHLRQVMTVDEVEDYVDVEKGFSATVQPTTLGSALLAESTRAPLTLGMANELLNTALKLEEDDQLEGYQEQDNVDALLKQYGSEIPE